MNLKFTVFSLIIFCLGFSLKAQNFADKDFYLIDSLRLEDLSLFDKTLLDSSLSIYQNSNEDTVKLNALLHIVEYSWDLNIWPAYNKYIANYSKNILKNEKNKSYRDKILFFKAYSYATNAAFYLEIGGSDSVLVNLDKALSIYTQINSLKEISGVYALYAVFYNNNGNVLKSLEYNNKSLKISETINDYAGLSYAYTVLANHSFDVEDEHSAIAQFKKAYKFANLNKDIRFAGINLIDLGKTFFSLNQLDSSLYYVQKGEALVQSVNDSYGIINAKNTKAKIFLQQKNYKQAEVLLQEIIVISRKNKSNAMLSMALKDLAKVKLAQNKLIEAEKLAKEAVDLSKSINRLEIKINTIKVLFDIYEKQNKNDLALNLLKEYNVLRDSIFNKENKKSILEQEVKISYEKQKEIDNIKHEKEIAIADAERQKDRIGMFSVVIIAILIAVFSIFTYNRLKLIKKQKNALDNAYEQLEESKKNELAVSNLKALQSQMNPHFIFNALNSVQDLVLLQDIRNSNKYLGKFSDLIRKILLSSKEQFISLSEEIEILRLYLDLEKLRFGEDFEINFQCNVDEEKREEIELPAMFIQPYIENAIKHGLFNKKGVKRLSVFFSLINQTTLECIVEDNGIGQEQSAIFKEKRLHLHTGFSTEAINERIRLLNETLDKKIELEIIDLEEDSKVLGTKIILHFPI